MFPSQQRFHPGNGAAVSLDNGLIVDVESIGGERPGNLALDKSPLLEFRFHVRGEGDDRPTTAALGGAQCKIGAARELVADHSVMRRDGEADADAKLDDLVDPEWAD